MFHRFTVALLFTTLATPLLAQDSTPPSGSADDQLQCGFTRTDAPEYVMWICNAAGTELSPEGVILWTRKTDAGADVVSTVWTGRVAELPKRAKTIIEAHRRDQAGCDQYVHVARATGSRPDWNVAAQSARRTIEELRSAHPGLCYAPHPATADYVLAWADDGRLMPSAFSVEVPRQLLARDGNPNPPTTPEFVNSAVRDVVVYRVVPGVDGTILRLGAAVYASAAPPDATQRFDVTTALEKALDSVPAK